MCAIIGGEVYRGSLYPMMAGHYLFADLCSGRVYGLLRHPDDTFSLESSGKISGGNVTTFAEGPDGELFIAAHNNIYRISAETVILTPQSYLPSIQFTD